MRHRVASSNEAKEWDALFSGNFTPLPELRREDANLILKLIIKGTVSFHTPVDDPLFSAHKPSEPDDTGDSTFFSDTIASTVGCYLSVPELSLSFDGPADLS